MSAQVIALLMAGGIAVAVYALALGLGRSATRGDRMNASQPPAEPDDRPDAQVLDFKRPEDV